MIEFKRNPRTWAIGGILAAAILPQVLLQTYADTPPATTRPAELTKLLQQRAETLKHASDVANQLFDRGLGQYATVMQCDELYADARLEATDSPSDRMSVLKESKETAVEREKMTAERHRQGFVTDIDVSLATAYRLKLEIRILKEQAQ